MILRSTQHNEDAAQASGINTAYYKIAGFVVSGFFAGIGGAMYTHTKMQVNPEMLAGSLSVMIVLFAVAGGRGSIMGPVFAAAGLTLLNEWLRNHRGVSPGSVHRRAHPADLLQSFGHGAFPRAGAHSVVAHPSLRPPVTPS